MHSRFFLNLIALFLLLLSLLLLLLGWPAVIWHEESASMPLDAPEIPFSVLPESFRPVAFLFPHLLSSA